MISLEKLKYNYAPGRGIMNKTAHELRLDFFRTLAKNAESIISTEISLEQVQNNIESFIGTTEIPMGLAGPLLFKSEEIKTEWVYTGICTTEGALVASINRGAKAISECGGFSAHFVHQKMLRSPLFTFNNLADAIEFEKWLRTNFNRIKNHAASYSNHAELIEIKSFLIGRLAHLKFIYTTSDASGQNMVTHCTWQACLWIEKQFQKESEVKIEHFYIDGNGSSDKKVSFYSLQNGRGVHVTSECFLSDDVIEKTLRSTADEMFKLYCHSMAISRFDGIIGGTLNIANVIAGIFAATGQDLGSIHESSLGVTQVERVNDGLYISLSIPALVIGTVGGGTHLPIPNTILELMNCKGKGKLERFSKLIAGFALSLEISTLATLASGQFARAHQKLGKNKTINWLLKSDINTEFIKSNIGEIHGSSIDSIELIYSDKISNGILTNLVQRVSKKMVGFIPMLIHNGTGEAMQVLLKSKPLDDELIEGLHFMASNINSALADNLILHKENLEYKNSHIKEIEIYKFLHRINYPFIPEFYGDIQIKEREIYLFLLEKLNENDMEIFNSENETKVWTDEFILEAINSIHIIHKGFLNGWNREELNMVPPCNVTLSLPFYQQSNQINQKEYLFWELDNLFQDIGHVIELWKSNPPVKISKQTLVHNDFNSRNVGVRKNGQLCIYDWELAMLNIPQRDIFEFLAFTLDTNFKQEQLKYLLKSHFELIREINGDSYSWKSYINDFIISGYEFLITRATFYLAGNTLLNYSFIKRVFICANNIIKEAKGFYE
jgi:hydroxymethylglutaryl-CoA reductase (NADPH)